MRVGEVSFAEGVRCRKSALSIPLGSVGLQNLA